MKLQQRTCVFFGVDIVFCLVQIILTSTMLGTAPNSRDESTQAIVFDLCLFIAHLFFTVVFLCIGYKEFNALQSSAYERIAMLGFQIVW